MTEEKASLRVVVSEKEKAIRNLPEAIRLAGYDFTRYRKVLIKPNVCGMYNPEMRLLEKIVDVFHPHAEAIIIGETDSAMHSPETQFRRLGIDKLAKRPKVEVKNLLKDATVRVKVPSPHAMKEIPLPSSIFETDTLVNVPGIGTHSNTRLTCVLKNLFGLVAIRSKYSVLHPLGVSEVIADLSQIVGAGLNVVDAKSKVLVGVDALRVDVVAAKMMGISPTEIRHLRLVSKDRGIELENVRIDVVEHDA